jgi:hypothetical protein
MHLTNYSLNKYSKNFEANIDGNDGSQGSKRSIEWLNEYLTSSSEILGDYEEMWEKIDDLIIKSVIAMLGPLTADYKASFAKTKLKRGNNNCFHILGFDVLLDENLDPWLIEINNHPSLQSDAPIDLRIKTGLVRDAFSIVGYDLLKTNLSREEYEENHVERMRFITPDHVLSHYSHLSVFASEQLINLFHDACGVRKRYAMTSSRFIKFARDHQVIQQQSNVPALVGSAQIDLLFIAVTCRGRSSTLSYEQFLDCLIYLSKKLYGASNEEKKSYGKAKEDIHATIVSETHLPSFISLLEFLGVLQ